MVQAGKWAVLAIVLVVLIGSGIYLFTRNTEPEVEREASETPIQKQEEPVVFSIGKSVEGRDIWARKFGNGDNHIVLVGAIHGGYEWNSAMLAYQVIDYFLANPSELPMTTSLTIIPSLNPDGMFKVIGKEGRFTLEDVPSLEEATVPGRFNANGVDINRNFDCKWQPESTWRGNVVSAGGSAFSESEASAFRDFVIKEKPSAVVFWHSQANAVYASECEAGILPGTRNILNAYSVSSGYKAVDTFDGYEITGDADGWLASIGIPAVSVELSTHQVIEFEKNIVGVKSLLNLYSSSE